MSLSQYHRDKSRSDGRREHCKKCRLAKIKQFYDEHKGVLRLKARQHYNTNSTEILRKHKKWKEKNSEKCKAYTLKYRQSNLQKENARRAVMKRTYRKKLLKQPCIICRDKKVEAHHHDYTKPFDVIWLCKMHHAAWHRVFLTEQG